MNHISVVVNYVGKYVKGSFKEVTERKGDKQNR